MYYTCMLSLLPTVHHISFNCIIIIIFFFHQIGRKSGFDKKAMIISGCEIILKINGNFEHITVAIDVDDIYSIRDTRFAFIKILAIRIIIFFYPRAGLFQRQPFVKLITHKIPRLNPGLLSRL